MPSSPSTLPAGNGPGIPRVFGWHDHAALWFSLGVGLLVIQVGTYLVPALGARDALLAVAAGSIVGSGLLAWVARLACENGVSSAELIQSVYGRGFARLPVWLNVVQLLGWATFELVVMRDGTRAIAQQALGIDVGQIAPTLLWGLVAFVLLRGSMLTLVRRMVSRIALPLVVLSLLWLSFRFGLKLGDQGWGAFWSRAGDGSMNGFQAFDLVIAMPVSWLPLVADYARHGRSVRGTFAGTWLGYTIANVWCYALGVLVMTAQGPSADMFTTLLLAQGGLLALGLILVDELDNAYGDLYSGSISAHALWSRPGVKTWGTILVVASTVFAIALPMRTLEPFLMMLSSIFVPLFGTILGCQLATSRTATPPGAIRAGPAAIWVAGVFCYYALGHWDAQFGSALPPLLLTFVLGAISSTFEARRAHAV